MPKTKNPKIVFCLVHPGYSENQDYFKTGEFKEWLEKGEMKYPEDYVHSWKKLIDWVGKTENAHLYFEKDYGGFKHNKISDQLLEYAQKKLEKKGKLTTHTTPKTDEKLMTIIRSLKETQKNEDSKAEEGRKKFSEELNKITQRNKKRIKKEILKGHDPKDTLLFGCGEFALGCVSDSMDDLMKTLDVPKKNVFLHHDLCVTPLPKDAKEFPNYLKAMKDRRYKFHDFPSISFTKGKELKKRRRKKVV